MRTVVLRGWDGEVAQMHTDRASTKVAELTVDPRAALHVWIPRQALQLRLSVKVALTHGDVESWARVPQTARRVYGGHPVPGTVIDDPAAFTEAPEQERFTVLHCALHQMEVLHLGDALHRRAVFRRTDRGWSGSWLAP
jgi:pyridoxine/pyridoxamine 5'-phosphate oxidase